MKELYVRIKVRREQMGYTQKYIADCLDIDPGHYSRIEHGKVDITISRLESISNLLGTTPSELLASNAMPMANRVANNPKVTLLVDLDESIKADVITLAFGDRIIDIRNK
jgi:transcriptional regulator with XRE-family HTH domain